MKKFVNRKVIALSAIVLAVLLFAIFTILFSPSKGQIMEIMHINSAEANHGAKTGATANINLSTYKTGKFFLYRKNNVVNYNLYCSELGGSLSSRQQFPYDEYTWDYKNDNGSVYSLWGGNENNYKKLTYLKDTAWYKFGASENYTAQQLSKILNISETDVNNVIGNQNSVFKVYQYICWTYTKRVNNNHPFSPNTDLVGSELTFYNALVSLAENNYNKSEPEFKLEASDKIEWNEKSFVWSNVKYVDTYPLPSQLKLYVDGKEYTQYTYNNNTITINGIDNTQKHIFTLEAQNNTSKISFDASIWYNSAKQDMIEITEPHSEPVFGTKSVTFTPDKEVEKENPGKINLTINKVDEEGNKIADGAKFEITEYVPFKGNDTNSNNMDTNPTSYVNSIVEKEGTYKYIINEVVAPSDYIGLRSQFMIYANVRKVFVETKDSVDANGVTVHTHYYTYELTSVTFANGKTTKEVLCANGEKVTLKLELSADKTGIIVTVPNVEREFDLALTKSIVSRQTIDLKEFYDFNGNGIIDDGKIDGNEVDSYSDHMLIMKLYSTISVSGETKPLYDIFETVLNEMLSSAKTTNLNGVPVNVYTIDEINNIIEKYSQFNGNSELLAELLDINNDGNIDALDVSSWEISGMKQLDSNPTFTYNGGRLNGIYTEDLSNSTNTTADYDLNKKPVDVNTGDIVVYEIKVYNEGDYNASTVDVIDYIPQGLKVCDANGNIVEDGTVSVTFEGNTYNWTVEKLVNGKTKYKATTKIEKTIAAYDGYDIKSQSVFIMCKVDSTVTDGTILYNVAEIIGHTDSGNNTDRDSTEDSLNNKDNITNYEDKKVDETDTSIIKSEYNYEDDDDFERIKVNVVTNRKFDLALRKSIIATGSDVNNLNVLTGENDRNPKLNSDSYSSLLLEGTAEYYHPKQVLEVNKGDYIEYSIKVYNEGSSYDYAGYAAVITDYLPDGLKFVGLVAEDGKIAEGNTVKSTYGYGEYIYEYDETNNVLTLKYTKGAKTLVADEIKNNLNDQSSITGFYNISNNQKVEKDEQSINYLYQEIRIICQVTGTISNKKLTNVAEITKAIPLTIKEDTAIYTVAEGVTDRDSTPNTITTTTQASNLSEQKVNLDTYYEDVGVNDSFIEYYPGIEDDDDFETVIVKGNLDLALKKVITQVNGVDVKDLSNGEENTGFNTSRYLSNGENWVDITPLNEGKKDALYNMNKTPVEVRIGDTVKYRIMIFNEGTVDAKALQISDYIPVGLSLKNVYYNDTDKLAEATEDELTQGKIKTDIYNDCYTYDEENGVLQVHLGSKKLLPHFNGTTLSSYYITVECEVKEDATGILTNIAEITTYEKYGSEQNEIVTTDVDSSSNNWKTPVDGQDKNTMDKAQESWRNYAKGKEDLVAAGTWSKGYIGTIFSGWEDDDDFEKVLVVIEKDFDLSLRKFITEVNGEKLAESREPKVDKTKLANGESTTATYTHSKDAVLVSPTDIVTYTLRVYNEGEEDGYAKEIMDDVPEGVEMVAPTYDESGKPTNLNAEYGWVMYKEYVAEEDSVEDMITYDEKIYVRTNNAQEAAIIVTNYLSLENGLSMMTEQDSENPNLIKAYDAETNTLSHKEVKVEFKVKPSNEEDKIIINYAQIREDENSDGSEVEDIDSTPNVWEDGEDDQDIEKIKVRYFDLALYKWVSSTIVTEDGKTEEYSSEHTQDDKSNLVNVVIPKDKLDTTVVKFKYTIKVENQGNLAGYAKEIKDHIPQGLKFVAEDNIDYGWILEDDGTITTDYLKDKLLQQNETAEVEVVLTWINGENNLGEKWNYAEISEDYNDYGAPDKDSTPDNFTEQPQEDDEDGDVVMLTVRTGSESMIYIILGISVMTILTAGLVGIKKYVL